MLSVIFLFLIFLGNFNKVNTPTDHIHCEWFCTISGKSPVTGYKMEVWLNMSKLIDQKCVANMLYRNLKNTTTSGYVFVLLSRKERDYHDGFSFLHFTTVTALNHMFQTEHMNKTAMKQITCLVQPMSNQTEITVSNGLDVLNSLRFYLSFDNQSWNIPFASYVHLEGNHHIFAGFSNGNVPEYQFTMDSSFHKSCWQTLILYTLLLLLVFTLFCNPIEKIKRERGTPEAQEHELSGSSPEDDVTQQKLTGSNDNELGSIEEHHPESSNNRKNAAASQTVATGSKKADDDVDLIDCKGSVSPIGIINLFSCIFLNKENSDEEMWKKVCCAMVKFVILIMFPFGFLPWIDVFVLGIPNLFFKGSTNLPLPYLTKLVLTVAFERKPFLFVCVFVFGMRMLFVCFKPSSGNWFEKKLGKPQCLFLKFVSFCFSIGWVAYISYCCSLSLLMAITSLLISGMKYPIETFSSVGIYVVTWHSIWTFYSLFTDKYFALLSKLFKICKNNHGDQMKKYTIGVKMYIPKALFDSACDNFEPVTENVKELFWQLFFYIIGHLFLFSIVCGTNYPKSVVLPVTLKFFMLFHPLLWDSLRKSKAKKKFRESVEEEEIKNLVNDFFMGKIG